MPRKKRIKTEPPKEKVRDYESHSSISTYAACPRKWFISYVMGVKTSPTVALMDGTDLHTAIEQYIPEGIHNVTNEKIVTLIENNIEFLENFRNWHKSEDLETFIELEISGQITEDIKYKGYIDFLLLDHASKQAHIFDHKKVGDWKWAKTEGDLFTDPQLNMYGIHIWNKYPGYKIYVYHNQFNSKTGGAARQVKAELAPEMFTEFWDTEIIEPVEEMQAYRLKSTEEIPQNFDHCKAYGGCPFQDFCHNGKKIKEGMTMEPKSPFFAGNKKFFPNKEKAAVGVVVEDDTPVTKDIKFVSNGDKPVTKKNGIFGDDEEVEEKPVKKAKKTKKAPKKSEAEAFVDELRIDNKPEIKQQIAENTAVLPTFCLNCLPMGKSYTEFKDILQPYVDQIQKSAGVSNIHLIKFNQGVKDMTKYGKEITDACCKYAMIFVDMGDSIQSLVFDSLNMPSIVFRSIR